MACCKESGGTEGWAVWAKGRVAHVRTAQCGTKRNPGRIVDTCSYHTGERTEVSRAGQRKREKGMSGLDCKSLPYVHMLKAWSQEHQCSEVRPLRKIIGSEGV